MDEMELELNFRQGKRPGMIWGPQPPTQRVPYFLKLATHLDVRPRPDMRTVIIVISHTCHKIVGNYTQINSPFPSVLFLVLQLCLYYNSQYT